MVQMIAYDTAMDVTVTWARLKKTPEYKGAFGEHIFLKFFELEPEAIALFDLHKNQKVFMHATAVIEMLDMVIDMLGPDLDVIANDVVVLGQSHAQHGVTDKHLSSLGKAIFYSIEKILGSKFTQSHRTSWNVFFSS